MIVIDPQFLPLLRCPISGSALHLADDALIEKINRAIAAGQLVNRLGQAVTVPLCGGLINEDRSVLYAIRNRIPSLIADEAIALEPPVAAESSSDGEGRSGETAT